MSYHPVVDKIKAERKRLKRGIKEIRELAGSLDKEVVPQIIMALGLAQGSLQTADDFLLQAQTYAEDLPRQWRRASA